MLFALAKCYTQLLKKAENAKIIGLIVRVGEVCDKNGDTVSKNNKSCHICITQL